jgi:glucosamine--fructose-6-phosphate aminotransferase (isomerizing)
VRSLLEAAGSMEIPVDLVDEPAPLPVLLAQIPLTVRLQMLALRLAVERGQDPDTVIVGGWADENLWRVGRPDG